MKAGSVNWRDDYFLEGNPYNRTWFEGKFTEEQPMRNTIKILDNDKQKPNFSNIEIGSCFKYPKNISDNVYMKSFDASHGKASAVLLSSGSIYTDINEFNEVELVSIVQISR